MDRCIVQGVCCATIEGFINVKGGRRGIDRVLAGGGHRTDNRLTLGFVGELPFEEVSLIVPLEFGFLRELLETVDSIFLVFNQPSRPVERYFLFESLLTGLDSSTSAELSSSAVA